MRYAEVMALLEQNADPRGIAHWNKIKKDEYTNTTFGIGVTKLRALAKKIKKDHELALQLWDSNVWDAKMIAIFIEEPKKITKEQIERQIAKGFNWLTADKYCELIVETPYALEFIEAWKDAENELTRRSAYTLLSYVAKGNPELDDTYFFGHLEAIRNLQQAPNFVKDAMNNCLLTIGSRSWPLYTECLVIAKSIGKVVVDYGDNSCQALDAVKHLNGDRIKNKFALTR
ncbi:MAG: DNA alkylation repair protein [Chitinophagales bacterium]|nr:DNA alkylation repair protein [Chitinophagales bacterium]